jgi:hypothetical protein
MVDHLRPIRHQRFGYIWLSEIARDSTDLKWRGRQRRGPEHVGHGKLTDLAAANCRALDQHLAKFATNHPGRADNQNIHQ